MKRFIAGVVIGVCGLLATGVADAHVSISSGPGFATKTQEVVFGVGHGCEGADTYSIKIDIPAAITSVRALNSDLGKASVEKNGAGAVTSVTWQKADADLLSADTNYYKVALRLKVPDAAFSVLHFVVHQTCKSSMGAITTVDWISPEKNPPMGVEPAAALLILPARQPGWNKFTVPQAIEDLASYFGDAQIVWRGDAAYSPNAATMEQISATAGVSALTALAANDEVWVKY